MDPQGWVMAEILLSPRFDVGHFRRKPSDAIARPFESVAEPVALSMQFSIAFWIALALWVRCPTCGRNRLLRVHR